MEDTEIAERVVALLNSMLEADSEATRDLVTRRVACNRSLADHPTVQVHVDRDAPDPFCVNLLGVLNGLFPDSRERIAVEWDIPADLEESWTLVRFKAVDLTKRSGGSNQ